MGGGEEDQQKLKNTAAAAYDYENDPRWADYWSNILIPPHMASRSDVVDHFKRKFYQRYIVSILTYSKSFHFTWGLLLHYLLLINVLISITLVYTLLGLGTPVFMFSSPSLTRLLVLNFS